MSVLGDLKEEIEVIEAAKELPRDAIIVMEIAKRVSKLETTIDLPREIIFRMAVQACFGKL